MHTHYNNTHKTTTTIHTANQQQLHTRQLKTNNNTHETNKNFTTYTKGKKHPNKSKNTHCVQFLVIVFFLQSLIHSRFHPSPSLLITCYSCKPFPQRLVPLPPLPYTAHFTSPHSTLLCFVHFTSLYCTSLPSTLDNISLH